MFNRQFGFLVMAVLVLSPSLVHANDIDEDDNLSVGNVQIQTTRSGTSIRTPKIQIDSPKTTENHSVFSRSNRRTRASIRRGRINPPSGVFNRRVEQNETVTTTTNNPSVFRSSTTRSSSNGSESVSEQRQSVNCSSGSSVHQSSSTTINGRTVHSESNCP
jgi:sigma54-dependent transcription regulator